MIPELIWQVFRLAVAVVWVWLLYGLMRVGALLWEIQRATQPYQPWISWLSAMVVVLFIPGLLFFTHRGE